MKRIYKIVFKLMFRRIGRYKNTARVKLFRFLFITAFLNCLHTSGKPIGRIRRKQKCFRLLSDMGNLCYFRYGDMSSVWSCDKIFSVHRRHVGGHKQKVSHLLLLL